MHRSMLALAFAMTASGALAQDAAGSSGASQASMAELLRQGYEIKAAVPNGPKYIVFLQKDNSAYACEFASLAKSRCGSIN